MVISPSAGELPVGAKQRISVTFQPTAQGLSGLKTVDSLLEATKRLKPMLKSGQIACYSVLKGSGNAIRTRDTVYLGVEGPAVPPLLVCSTGAEGWSNEIVNIILNCVRAHGQRPLVWRGFPWQVGLSHVHRVQHIEFAAKKKVYFSSFVAADTTLTLQGSILDTRGPFSVVQV
jgi:hypothetical protein